MRRSLLTTALVSAVIAFGASQALTADLNGKHGKAESGKRYITIAAVEPKGGTTIDKESFPAAALPGGGGYILKKPNDKGRWEASTYRFMPSQILVNQGDDVTLEYVGINGDVHPGVIEGYDIKFVVKRG